MDSENPYSPPAADIASDIPDNELDYVYVGFWYRVAASIIDTLMIAAITTPLLIMIYGQQYLNSNTFIQGPIDFILSYIFPLAATLAFWIYKSATPGKMIIKAKIVDAETGDKPSNGQLIGRYFGYYVSGIPLGLGFLWVAWDKEKQGWHDKLARTRVVRYIDN